MQSANVGSDAVSTVRALTARELNIDPTELEYISDDLLSEKAKDDISGIDFTEVVSVTPPNRISYISHVTVGTDGTNGSSR